MMEGKLEVISIKYIGGPREGSKLFKATDWPPPEELHENQDGVYVRELFSHLPPEVASHPSLMRGAIYRWERKEANVLG